MGTLKYIGTDLHSNNKRLLTEDDVAPTTIVEKGGTLWDSTFAYVVGDIVSYNEISYICIQASTNNLPNIANSTYWKKAVTETNIVANGNAPLYACRAWVNFNGTGTVAIRASGNVSSVIDNGVGKYIVNFTTAMEDANYNIAGSTIGSPGASTPYMVLEHSDVGIRSISSVPLYILTSGGAPVDGICELTVFR